MHAEIKYKKAHAWYRLCFIDLIAARCALGQYRTSRRTRVGRQQRALGQYRTSHAHTQGQYRTLHDTPILVRFVSTGDCILCADPPKSNTRTRIPGTNRTGFAVSCIRFRSVGSARDCILRA
eukprot:3358188-Rhodomonas_salina.2